MKFTESWGRFQSEWFSNETFVYRQKTRHRLVTVDPTRILFALTLWLTLTIFTLHFELQVSHKVPLFSQWAVFLSPSRWKKHRHSRAHQRPRSPVLKPTVAFWLHHSPDRRRFRKHTTFTVSTYLQPFHRFSRDTTISVNGWRWPGKMSPIWSPTRIFCWCSVDTFRHFPSFNESSVAWKSTEGLETRLSATWRHGQTLKSALDSCRHTTDDFTSIESFARSSWKTDLPTTRRAISELWHHHSNDQLRSPISAFGKWGMPRRKRRHQSEVRPRFLRPRSSAITITESVNSLIILNCINDVNI